jgi:hypothetical protein
MHHTRFLVESRVAVTVLTVGLRAQCFYTPVFTAVK